jgi:hypothetical protein
MNQYEFDRLMAQVNEINVVDTRQHDEAFFMPPTHAYVIPQAQAFVMPTTQDIVIPPGQAYVVPPTQDFVVPSTPRTPILRKR